MCQLFIADQCFDIGPLDDSFVGSVDCSAINFDEATNQECDDFWAVQMGF